MASLVQDTDCVGSQLYLALGLKPKRNGGAPKVLSIISTLLERSVQRNEKLFETGRKKEVITVFHGLRAPALSIANYLERIFKILITSVMVAAKFIDDAFCNNAYYARVGGVSTAEMNRLEMNFLFSLDFRLQVTVDTFQRHCLRLEKELTGGYQVERPIQILKLKEGWHNVEEATCTVKIPRLSCGS